MTTIKDPIRDGLARGWRVFDGAQGQLGSAGTAGTPGNAGIGAASAARAASVELPREIDCDVAIVGSGAGGGISAEILSRAGLKVVLIEEGPLKSSTDFRMLESDAYPQLYQESAARKTADKAITILQGRCVGGSTTVNWTSSFRTPPATLAYWADRFELKDYTVEKMAPYFAQVERRLNIQPWSAPPNENNELLRRGAIKLGISAEVISRNVNGCMNLGYCGMGCPTNAKQSMLVTTIPVALDHQTTLLTRARAQSLIFEANTQGRKVAGLEVRWLQSDGLLESDRRCVVRARHYVLAGGAINSPAILLRSQAPDPHKLTGKRTFLHPTVISAATFAQKINGFDGAPQTVYSDHFQSQEPIDGALGYKLEAPPIHPLLFATTLHGFGAEHAQRMGEFAKTHALIALIRDGFHPESVGGSVSLRADLSPVLEYPTNAVLFDAVKRAWLSMAQIQFAAGAISVTPSHEMAGAYRDWASAKAAIEQLPLKPLLARLVSAHVMGGCAIAGDEKLGLVRPDGVHYHIDNLSVHDGSLFPTSIGANPQLSIYALATRLSQALAGKLSGKVQPPLAATQAQAQAA